MGERLTKEGLVVGLIIDGTEDSEEIPSETDAHSEDQKPHRGRKPKSKNK